MSQRLSACGEPTLIAACQPSVAPGMLRDGGSTHAPWPSLTCCHLRMHPPALYIVVILRASSTVESCLMWRAISCPWRRLDRR
jgi:hypothetical protein